jgi:exopolyphosphatase/guanosine-5'-triphosphate,3'-diphosphate pyrophosphatase
MDIGGASTELIKIRISPFEIIKSISLPVGSVRATDWKKNGEFEIKINQILGTDLSEYYTKSLVCVAGSMTALASIYLGQKEYVGSKVEGTTISFSTFKAFTNDLRNTSVENLLLLFPFLGKRAPMIAGGSHIAELIGTKLKVEIIKISTRGLRYGTIVSGEIDEQYI